MRSQRILDRKRCWPLAVIVGWFAEVLWNGLLRQHRHARARASHVADELDATADLEHEVERRLLLLDDADEATSSCVRTEAA